MFFTNFFTQWTEMSQNTARVFTYVTQANMEAMQNYVSSMAGINNPQNGAKSIKSNLTSFHKVVDANQKGLGHLFQTQLNLMDLDGYGVLFKEVSKSLQKEVFNEVEYDPISYQKVDNDGSTIGLMSTPGMATAAIMDFRHLTRNLASRIVKQQANIIATTLDSVTLFVKKLKNAKVILDAVGAMTVMTHEIQTQYKESIVDVIDSFMAYKIGSNVLVEDMVERIDKATVDSQHMALNT